MSYDTFIKGVRYIYQMREAVIYSQKFFFIILLFYHKYSHPSFITQPISNIFPSKFSTIILLINANLTLNRRVNSQHQIEIYLLHFSISYKCCTSHVSLPKPQVAVSTFLYHHFDSTITSSWNSPTTNSISLYCHFWPFAAQLFSILYPNHPQPPSSSHPLNYLAKYREWGGWSETTSEFIRNFYR